jgi:hypothetical protein
VFPLSLERGKYPDLLQMVYVAELAGFSRVLLPAQIT